MLSEDRYLEFPIRSDLLTQRVKVSKALFSERSEYQQIDILDTEVYGRVLLLDGHIQLAELDEHVYHEALVHPALLSMEAPESALVIGGGDGGVLRELCRHASIARIDMAEIDERVVSACKEHLPQLSAGAFDDPRVHLHIGDAFEFVKERPTRYDLVIADSTDVYEDEEGELSERLFSAEFFEDIRKLLKPTGMIVTQADNLVFCPYSLEEIRTMFESVFDKVGSYFGVIPSFGGFSGYCWGSMGAEMLKSFPARAGRLDLRYLSKEAYEFGFSRLSL